MEQQQSPMWQYLKQWAYYTEEMLDELTNEQQEGYGITIEGLDD